MGITNGIGIIGLCMYAIGAVTSTTIHSDNNDKISNNRCSTISCSTELFRAFHSIVSYMNTSVSPCNNFYDYVCGNYEEVLNKNEPYKVIAKSNEDIIIEKLFQSIRNIRVATEKSRPRKLVRQLYDMCMKKKNRQAQTPKSLLEIINELYGWPMLDDKWDEKNWRWENVYNKATNLGIPTDIFLIDINVRDPQNPSPALKIYHPDSIDYDWKLFNKILKEYNADYFQVSQDIEELKSFEKDLGEMMGAHHLFPIKTDLTEARTNFANIDWNKFFNMSAYGIEFNSTEPIIIENTDLMNYINNNTIPKRALANYQMLRFIKYITPYLSWDSIDIIFDWKTCVGTVGLSLPHIMDAMLIQDHIDKDIKNEVLEMIANIKDQFKKAFNSISWLDQPAREFAIEKLEAIKYSVAYPDEAFDNELLNELYKDYEIIEGDFLKTALRFNFLSQKRKMPQYKTFNHSSYEAVISWADSWTYNLVDQNGIRISTGYLQGENYNKFRPKYMNYATLGRQIAHEILHAFDKDGIYFNNYGSFGSPMNSINESVFQEYDRLTRCLTDQYNQYKDPITDTMVDGSETNTQNMADVNGIRVAYHTYQQWIKNHGPDVNIPYGGFTQNQLYWISFAHSHCTVSKPSPDTSFGEPPSKVVRVIGSVSNSPEFAADFECAIGTPMNPENKCIYA